MKHLLAAFVVAVALLGCATTEDGWITLLDANRRTLENWNRVGDANWRIEEGAVVFLPPGGAIKWRTAQVRPL